jgi:hypothetical protein
LYPYRYDLIREERGIYRDVKITKKLSVYLTFSIA